MPSLKHGRPAWSRYRPLSRDARRASLRRYEQRRGRPDRPHSSLSPRRTSLHNVVRTTPVTPTRPLVVYNAGPPLYASGWRLTCVLESMHCGERGQVWLRRQVVALEIEGSNPFAHPIKPPSQRRPSLLSQDRRPSGREACARSSGDRASVFGTECRGFESCRACLPLLPSAPKRASLQLSYLPQWAGSGRV